MSKKWTERGGFYFARCRCTYLVCAILGRDNGGLGWGLGNKPSFLVNFSKYKVLIIKQLHILETRLIILPADYLTIALQQH